MPLIVHSAAPGYVPLSAEGGRGGVARKAGGPYRAAGDTHGGCPCSSSFANIAAFPASARIGSASWRSRSSPSRCDSGNNFAVRRDGDRLHHEPFRAARPVDLHAHAEVVEGRALHLVTGTVESLSH